MRHVSLVLVAALLLLLVAPARSAGYTDISGQLGGGWEVLVDTEPPITVWVWQRQKNGKIVNSTAHKSQGCVIDYDDSKPGKEVRVLSCPANGVTPLAGTKYVGRPFHGDCEKGDPEFLFKCVSGCGPNSRAPKTMRQEHWEC